MKLAPSLDTLRLLDLMQTPGLRFPRWARTRLRIALWRTQNHPAKLTQAAQAWLATGRFLRALDYADLAYHRLTHDPTVAEALRRPLLARAATVAVLACCHLRNIAKTPAEQQEWHADARHWMDTLVGVDHEALADHVLHQGVVRDDLRRHGWRLLEETTGRVSA